MKVVITGGSGFLGRALIEELLDNSCPIQVDEICVFDLVEPKENYADKRLQFIRGDVRNLNQLKEAIQSVDMVFHSAAIVDWGTKSEKEVYAVNYHGTQNVILACRKNKVRNLVYTSSLDTVFSGEPLIDVDESYPYPSEFPNMYCKSKFMAEKLVRESQSSELKTCVLRPADIYGEGDLYHVEALIEMAKGGFYIRLGNGQAKCQHVYVKNVAHAHILAGKALMENNEKIFGNAYFITDGPPENFFTFFDEIVERAGYRIWPSNLWIPRNVGYFIGMVSEGVAKILRPVKYYNPKMSRFAVVYTCTDFTFTSQRARNDFNFIPKYSVSQAVDNTVKYFQKK